MARQADQKMRYNDAELSLMKNTFADNDDLLFAVRKSLLGYELDKTEKKLVKGAMSPETHAILEKTFLPFVDVDAPLFQLTDLYMTLANDMKTLGVEAMAPLIQAKRLEIDYMRQELDVLKDVDAPVNRAFLLSELVDLGGKSDDQAFVDITARNYLLSWIDSNIQQIKFLAGKKEESVQETLDRLQKNSAK